jgi:hypothetical protein
VDLPVGIKGGYIAKGRYKYGVGHALFYPFLSKYEKLLARKNPGLILLSRKQSSDSF